MLRRSLALCFVTLALVACGDDTPNDTTNSSSSSGATSTSSTGGGSSTSSTSSTSGAGGAGGSAAITVDRGPTIVAIDGDPNGLWWDEGGSTLYIADDNNNRILRWTDADGTKLHATLPTASNDGPGLGQLARKSDGTIIVTRFGYGTAGDVVVLSPTHVGSVVPNLPVERRRIGLTITDGGDLYDSWFVKLGADAPRVGSVGKLGLSGTEAEVITGLKKPVGVLAVGDKLYVSDQDQNAIFVAPLSNLASYKSFATVTKPDLLAAGPSGSLFAGSEGTNVYKVASDGTASVFQSGLNTVRGVAYDATNKRLFIVDHEGHDELGTTNTIHILPVD